MDLGVRKFCTFIEEVFVEGGKKADQPISMVVVAAVLKNPWAGQG
ncbi:MAG: amino acid synthesis family protein, partial [Mesorhizobium sp.]